MCAPQLPCKDRGWVLQLACCDETIWDPNEFIKQAGGDENCFGFVWRHLWSHSVKQNKIGKKNFVFSASVATSFASKWNASVLGDLNFRPSSKEKHLDLRKNILVKPFNYCDPLFLLCAFSLCVPADASAKAVALELQDDLCCLPLHFLHSSSCTVLTSHQSGRQHWRQSMTASFPQCLCRPGVPFEAKWNKDKS